MVKIETHMHTKYSSRCGMLDATTLVTEYIKSGYSGVVVTDHFNRVTYDAKGIDLFGLEDKAAVFLEGYHKIKEEGYRLGLKVYKGAEFRFDESENDYLLLGFDDCLLSKPNEVFELGLENFYKRYHQSGILIIQAHPFRRGCAPANPSFLDGVEVQNMHPTHESNNDLAWDFAKRNPRLIRTSGSDCHRFDDIARGGISAPFLPENEKALVSLLLSGEYTLLG